MHFLMAVNPEAEQDHENPLIFAFHGDQLLVVEAGEKLRVPGAEALKNLDLKVIRRQYLGTLEGRPCYSIDLDQDSGIQEGTQLLGLREVYGSVGEDYFALAVHAFQIVNWDRMHQYCGKCGTMTGYAEGERAKVCSNCGSVYFPRISPAVIVAVRKDDQLLLLRNKRYRHDFYSVLAGFVEAGESLEECLIREVREEAGIEVKNIQYFGSQPWPFPNSLMIGFTAEYAGGELCLEEAEIADADWYRVEEFPKIPGSISIARKLIDHFVEEQQKQ